MVTAMKFSSRWISFAANVTAIGCLVIAARAEASLIVNGGFEDPVVAPGTYAIFTPGQSIGSGWTAVGDAGTNVLVIQTTYTENPFGHPAVFNAQEGLNSVDLTGAGNLGPTAGITQTVATVVGQQYLLSFHVGRVAFNNGPSFPYVADATVNLKINGGALVPFTNSGVTNGQIHWTQFDYAFVATSASTNLSFLNGTPAGVGGSSAAELDNVSLVAVVPEPTSFALLGFGLCTGMRILRRRRVPQMCE
jgi:hypothetical protein